MRFGLEFATLLGVLTLVAFGCGQTAPQSEPIRPVRAMKVGDVSGFTGREWPGRAAAAEEVDRSFRISGPLVALLVNVGDTVEEGELLAKIDPRDFDVDLRSADANLTRAKENLAAMEQARPEELAQLEAGVKAAQAAATRAGSEAARGKELADQGIISQEEHDEQRQELDRTEAELRQAQQALRIGQLGARPEDIRAKEAEIAALEAAIEMASNRLADTDLKAPFAGTVAATYVENYQMVRAHEPILRLLDTRRIEMTIDLPESLISLVPYVEEVECRFDAIGGEPIPARVKEVGTEASRTTRTYPVTLIMDQPPGSPILPGMAGVATGRGELPDSLAETGLEVPGSAVLLGDDGGEFVWLIDEKTGLVSRRQVHTEGLTPRGIRITGVELGEWIATAGLHTLVEGQKVRILNDPAKESSP